MTLQPYLHVFPHPFYAARKAKQCRVSRNMRLRKLHTTRGAGGGGCWLEDGGPWIVWGLGDNEKISTNYIRYGSAPLVRALTTILVRHPAHPPPRPALTPLLEINKTAIRNNF
ncbi:unnamed protein product [Colias eurytheme]|nr:unnamed protein product [Colias eurytheme]